ncbi:hypothetical protein NM208_g8741 [Fusarium decemcellulare]|uniref:Uncharacterized protein n=1 Tax=Fusarium decemcellulare TaxID=57161 RepID=A0ACC1S457_9HYPO|nr:hypothetical protein NM208_g8741 [Fusarium decemcellulare]
MAKNHNATIEYFGLACPDGGKVYICEDAKVEFFGCCTSDPCADGKGTCPKGHLRQLALNMAKYDDLLPQSCDDPAAEKKWYTCKFNKPPYAGCCNTNPCKEGKCPRNMTVPAALTNNLAERLWFLNPPVESQVWNTTISADGKDSTGTLESFADHATSSDSKGSIGYPAVAGICIAAMVAALLCLGGFWMYCQVLQFQDKAASPATPGRLHSGFEPVDGCEPEVHGFELNFHAFESLVPKTNPTIDLPADWHHGPKRLHSRNLNWTLEWVWDVILTLVPVCFIALALIAIRLDGQPESAYGERVRELIKLSPSLYPILFAAVTSRFYKNVARWSLEKPNGIRLAVLEQIFGSQSFAAAFERVFLIRTQVTIGLIILLTWAMSPLGGQSSSRLLSFGNTTTTSNGTIYFYNPDYQVSYYNLVTSSSIKNSVTALYSGSMLSSLQQKRSPRDLWDLPKIPQLSKKFESGHWYDVDDDALASGDNQYASLLGIKLQGFDSMDDMTEYDFDIQTSYIDFKCKYAGMFDDKFNQSKEANGLLNLELASPFMVNVTAPASWDEWMSLDDPPAVQIDYFSKGFKSKQDQDVAFPVQKWFRTKCSMETVLVETAIHCDVPSTISCFAQRQRQIESQNSSNRLPEPLSTIAGGLQRVMLLWPPASGEGAGSTSVASPTENYILEETHPFSGQELRIWPDVDFSVFPGTFSRRFTAAFNTYWDATLNPLTHTNVSFDSIPDPNILMHGRPGIQPFMNSTTGIKTTTQKVYRANRAWVAVLLTTTTLLEVFAIVGLLLQIFIRGPDVLGFASSMTRDNPYVPLPPGGSHMDGADRAKVLGDLRLQLADVRPEDETGYVAVKAVPSGDGSDEQEQAVWKPLDKKRLYA